MWRNYVTEQQFSSRSADDELAIVRESRRRPPPPKKRSDSTAVQPPLPPNSSVDRRRSSTSIVAKRRASTRIATPSQKASDFTLRVHSPPHSNGTTSRRKSCASDDDAPKPVLDRVEVEDTRRSRSLQSSRNPSPFEMTSAGMFDKQNHSERPAPEMPTTDDIEYPRAAAWSSSTVEEILRDPLGRQVFRCFLFESLAEENLLFVDSVDALNKEKNPAKIREGIKELLDTYGQYINLSSGAMARLREAAQAENPDHKALDVAHKEISKLLENDQFPRFRRSGIYIEYLEKLLPRAYAERWATSFEAMLGNQVYLPFGVRQQIEKRVRDKDVDETLFDDAVKHVEQILKNDPYVRFLQSNAYTQLLAKLTLNSLGCMKPICGGNLQSSVRGCQSDGTDCGHFNGKRNDNRILKAVDLLCESEEAIFAPFDGELSFHQPFGGETDFQCADQGAGNLDCALDPSKRSSRNYVRIELFRNAKEVDITQHLVDCMCTGQICETNYNNRLVGEPFRVISGYNGIRGWEIACELREEDEDESADRSYEDDPLAPTIYSPIEGEILGRVRLNHAGNIYAGCENDAVFITGIGTWLDYEVRLYNVRYREELGFGRKHVVQGQPIARRLTCNGVPDSVFMEVRFQGVVVDITEAITATSCRHRSFNGIFRK
ncbi:Peptidase M23 domain-containing protein [Aphelenchoides besseyi]|nr:Peptidase M23 domain-containing protein [Aphelenchoides besseyi]